MVDLEGTIEAIVEEKLHDLPTNSSGQITGEGFPEGKVTAPIGTIYIDSRATNGALRWIKKSGAGNTGWVILSGDTGIKTYNSSLFFGGSRMYMRRVDNTVTIGFGGLQYDLFALKPKAEVQSWFEDKPNNVKHLRIMTEDAPIGQRKMIEIPDGFRPIKPVMVPLFVDDGRVVGAVYVASKHDGSFARFHITEEYPTDGYKDLRVGSIIYMTDESYPSV